MTTEQESTIPPPVKCSMTATRSIHRAPPAVGLSEHRLAVVGQIVATIHGHDSYERSAAIEFMRQELEDLREPTSALTAQRLTLHLPVMEAQFLHFAKRAAATSNPDAAVKFAKLSMQFQSGFTRTVEVLADLQKLRPHDLVEPVPEGEGEGDGE